MGMEDIVTMLEKCWVRACFSGHEHNFQHAQHNGVTYFVTGAGSKVRTSVSNKFADAHTRSWAATRTRGSRRIQLDRHKRSLVFHSSR